MDLEIVTVSEVSQMEKDKYHMLSFICVCVHAKLLQSCLCVTLCTSLPGSSDHRILQARILEWVAISSSKRSSWPRDQTCVLYISCIGRQILYHWCHLGSPFYIWNNKKKKIRLNLFTTRNRFTDFKEKTNLRLPDGKGAGKDKFGHWDWNYYI